MRYAMELDSEECHLKYDKWQWLFTVSTRSAQISSSGVDQKVCCRRRDDGGSCGI